MKIFYIERNDRYDYDEYDSAVVVANSPEEAVGLLKKEHEDDHETAWGNWDVEVVEIVPEGEPWIVIESFNGG